jgi:thiamine-monophosphate kinase
MSDDKPTAASGEDRLIARFFRPLAKHPGAFGLADDAAVLTPLEGFDVVLKADAIVGGVHFFEDDPPGRVAQKALRVNLSDLAAKGAKPAGFLLSLMLPNTVGDAWLAGFAMGLGLDADAYGCPLMGGDTDFTPGPVTVSIAAFGTVPRGTMVRRSGAQPGDRLIVTGTVGDAALGLLMRRDAGKAKQWFLDSDQREHLTDRYLLPRPRNALAEVLRRHASAAMDVSDGLAGDLAKLCMASGVAAEVEVARVPLSDAARKALAVDPDLTATALTGGDDYEIIATIAPDKLDAFQAESAQAGIAVSEIGRIVAGGGETRFTDRDGRRLEFRHASYSHF